MKKLNKLKLATLSLTAVILVALGHGAFAHTRFDVSTQTEGTRIINHLVTGEVCSEINTKHIGISVVFPDGVDSIILADGQPHNGLLADFLTNYGGNVTVLRSRAVFERGDKKTDPNGNVVGFWGGDSPDVESNGVEGNLNAAIPFRIKAADIEPTSCAAKVNVMVSIVDICAITSTADFDGAVKLWTHNDLGTPFDRVSETDDGPATFTIARDLAKNPLPESCGEGFTVVVKPSAAQINRDMPISVGGQQVWPLP